MLDSEQKRTTKRLQTGTNFIPIAVRRNQTLNLGIVGRSEYQLIHPDRNNSEGNKNTG